MNKQGKLVNGKVVGGIEFCKTVLPDGTERQGYTANPLKGCQHECRWSMPDGQIAVCYAEEMSNRFRPGSFQRVTFHPEVLTELTRRLARAEPCKVFIDSASDLFGLLVHDHQIQAVLNCIARLPHVTFISLTKNAPRLLNFDLPHNLWTGVSMPPDWMYGRRLMRHQQEAMLRRSLDVLTRLNVPVKVFSFEPLSWDVSDIVAQLVGMDKPITWAFIGAASHGRTIYQPDPDHVTRLLRVLDLMKAKVFMKGNLRGNPAITRWREEFPEEMHS